VKNVVLQISISKVTVVMYTSVSIVSWNFYWYFAAFFTGKNQLKIKWIFTGIFSGFLQVKQEAELAHRNRAAGSVSFGSATGGSLYAQNLRLRGRLSPTICARLDRSVNALQLCH